MKDAPPTSGQLSWKLTKCFFFPLFCSVSPPSRLPPQGRAHVFLPGHQAGDGTRALCQAGHGFPLYLAGFHGAFSGNVPLFLFVLMSLVRLFPVALRFGPELFNLVYMCPYVYPHVCSCIN